MLLAWFQPVLKHYYRPLLASACYVVLFLALDQLAVSFGTESIVSLWYPSSALSLVLIIGFGPICIPALLLANLLSLNWHYQMILDGSVMLLVLAHTLCYGAGGIALRRMLPNRRLDTIQAISRFLAIGMLTSVLVALVSCAVLAFDGELAWPEYPQVAFNWWLGDQIGIIVIVPLLLIHVLPWFRVWEQHNERILTSTLSEWVELCAQAISIVGTLLLVFVSPFAAQQPLYLCFLPLIWIVLRFGLPGAIIAISSLSFGAMIASAQGFVPITGLIDLQLFMLAIALTGLLLGASVSEQRATARALQSSEARARAIVQDQTDLVCRYRSDTTLTFVNDAYCQFFGRTADELLGHSFMWMARPEYHAIIRQQIATIVSNREPFTDESLIYRRDGALRWMQWVNRVIVDADGQTVEIQVVGRDITERKEAEVARQQAEERYRMISQMTSDYGYLYTIEADGVMRRDWLAGAFTRITGYELDEFDRNGGWEAILYPPDLPEVFANRIRLAQGIACDSDVRIQHKDGSIRWLHNTLLPEMDPETGKLARVYGAVQDISERKQAEETRRAIDRQIQETQKLESIGVLAGGIAHDFNNLLVGVMGNAGLALAELPDDSPARFSVHQIEIAAHHAANLTRQLLAYAGKSRVIVRRLHINPLIEEMIQLLHVGIPRQVELIPLMGSDLPEIEGDVTQLRQVLMNIVINAAEAIGSEPGVITITTDSRWVDRTILANSFLGSDLPEHEYVVIEVTDSGCGMDEATCERIFEPFFTTKFTGRGLGLAAVLGIVRSHGGALNITSVLGNGSIFTILLPSATEPSLEQTLVLEEHSQAFN